MFPPTGDKIIAMLDTWQNVVIAILIVGAALLFRWLLERFWPAVKRRAHNDIIGWQLGILGTTYAVILGFMLYTVWTNFGLAELNADSEANAIVNVYRLADGLPAQQREQLRQAARNYVDVVIERDWPEMARNNNESLKSSGIHQQLWQILMSVKAAEPTEITAEDHALYELSSVSEHRRIRLLESTSRLPTILWWVLIFGGIVTIVSCCMFGADNAWLHMIQVFAFSLLIALVLLAIADIDRPFQGSVHVRDAAFRRAQQSMQD
ncbi:MAG TPA: DUF4239 domain-containing protein [Edaphobacter sp.]